MKVKNHQYQASSTSRSGSPAFFNNNTNLPVTSTEQVNVSHSAAYSANSSSSIYDSNLAHHLKNSMLTSSSNAAANNGFMTPTPPPHTSNPSQIWTRSAVRAAQLQKLNDISPCHKHHNHHHHKHNHHAHSQHVIGENNI